MCELFVKLLDCGMNICRCIKMSITIHYSYLEFVNYIIGKFAQRIYINPWTFEDLYVNLKTVGLWKCWGYNEKSLNTNEFRVSRRNLQSLQGFRVNTNSLQKPRVRKYLIPWALEIFILSESVAMRFLCYCKCTKTFKPET